MASIGKPWVHWHEDTEVEEGVWRDYYTSEKLEDFAKPWKKYHDERYGVGKDCLGLYILWRRTTSSNTTSPGARKAAPHRGEAAPVRMSNFHPCSLSGVSAQLQD